MVDLVNIQNGFVIAASDGLWDVRRREFFARQFQETFSRTASQPGEKLKESLLLKLYEVIEKVTPKNEAWYLDDITAIVMNLQGASD